MSGAPIQFRWDGEAEVWKTIPSFPAYSASSFGRIRRDALTYGGGGSVRRPSGALKQRALPYGHRQVTISTGNKPKTLLVHRLVAETFLPAPEDGQDCVCHRDDNPSNNRPENLFWGSKADNSADMVRKGRSVRGERVKGAKLDAAAVLEIRKRLSAGQNQYDLAQAFGVTQSNISMIGKKQTWRHVP